MRPLGAGGAAAAYTWARQRKDAFAVDQNVLTSATTAVTFNDYQDNDPANFAASGNGIKVLSDGLYSLLVRLFWGTIGAGSTDFKAEIYFAGIDEANYAAYNGASVFTDSNSVTTAQLVVRLAANQIVTAFVRQQSTKTWSLTTGSFFEAVRLGGVDVTDRGF